MRRLLFLLAFLASPAFAQQTLPSLPAGSTPYAGTDLFYCTIGGVSSKCAFSAILGAATQNLSASPAATTTATPGVMMAIGGAITPTKSGNVLINITGYWNNNTISDQCTLGIRTGTGTAPINGAAATGTARGSTQNIGQATAGFNYPFAVTSLVTGLTVGTAVWIDLAVFITTGGTCTLKNVTTVAVEQ